MRTRVALSLVVIVVLAVAGCESHSGGQSPPPSGPVTPTYAPTAMLASNIDLTIRLPRQALSARQQEVFAAYREFVEAHYRFYSHPWIIDPVYPRIVLPHSPYTPLAPDTIGMIGPLPAQVLSVNLTSARTASVEICLDERSLRYLGRNGARDITGPAGTHLTGDVVWEKVRLEYTKSAAIDGSTTTTPRWLVSKTGASAGAKQCHALAAMPPASPTPHPPITATPQPPR